MSYETVIGLEVHIQLNTSSKAFSGDQNIFGSEPNVHISPLTLAYPGTLPRVNKAHVHAAVKLGLALVSKINQVSIFDRKHYFYPDLPKGYQITQETLPIAVGGEMSFLTHGQMKTIRIHHLHMEEDAGKSTHDNDSPYSLVDLNRAGTPLIELVTEPDFRSAQEVYDFIEAIQRRVRYLEISDGNMEEGSLRCDCNVSVMKKGSNEFGERCEIKNVNSKRFARTAIAFESDRQIDILKKGGKIDRNTLLFDPVSGRTSPMRSKEDVNDYRYFPDPDLPPVIVSDEALQTIKDSIDILPETAYTTLLHKYNISADVATLISEEKSKFRLFEKFMHIPGDPQELVNLFVSKLLPYLKEETINPEDYTIPVVQISELLDLMASANIAKSSAYQHLVLPILDGRIQGVKEEARKLNVLISGDQSFVDTLIEDVLVSNPEKVNEYHSGKKGLIGFFMGEIMKASKGRANAAEVKSKLEARLNE